MICGYSSTNISYCISLDYYEFNCDKVRKALEVSIFQIGCARADRQDPKKVRVSRVCHEKKKKKD